MKALKQALVPLFPILLVSVVLGLSFFTLSSVQVSALEADEADGRDNGLVDESANKQVMTYTIYLPVVVKSPTPECPTYSSRTYNLIPFEPPRADRPDYLHADLNLARRGYLEVGEAKNLIDYNGNTDSDPPQLAGLFDPNAFPGITATYQVYDWIWNCGVPHGCLGSEITDPAVTMIGLNASPGEAIHIPERNFEIYGGGYKAMVLYAEERRITLGYTREDTVVPGYVVHLEDVCVDPNLLALYQSQVDSDGWHYTGYLPALRNNEALGTALDSEVKVVIRDKGSFMDPRSRKDWWQGYLNTNALLPSPPRRGPVE